jgi:endonuclease VIII
VPEGDTIFRAARTLNRALAGHTVTRFETVLPHLQRVHDDAPITGRTVEDVSATGKWMTIRFSGDLILLTHMLMSGSWHIYRPGERWRRPRVDMRIVIATAQFEAVAFRVPIAEFHSSASLLRRPGFHQLGPDVLSDEFDEQQAIDNLRAEPGTEVGEVLLKQRVLAGLGNVYKSEVCFACRVNPFRHVASLTEQEITCLIATARKFMSANVSDTSGVGIVTYTGLRRTTRRADPVERLWVYGRRGYPCRRCGTPILSRKQGPGARVTFWCLNCQREDFTSL